MSGLKGRVRRLSEQFVLMPTAEEYREAKNREQARTMKAIAEELHWLPGFPAHRVFTEWHRQVLLGDTPERRQRDRQTIEAWQRDQGIDSEMEAERANEKWEATLGARGAT